VERSVASRKTERFIGPDSRLIKLDMPLDASLQGVFKDNRATNPVYPAMALARSQNCAGIVPVAAFPSRLDSGCTLIQS
jgi:hypothetical protein